MNFPVSELLWNYSVQYTQLGIDLAAGGVQTLQSNMLLVGTKGPRGQILYAGHVPVGRDYVARTSGPESTLDNDRLGCIYTRGLPAALTFRTCTGLSFV